MRSDEDEREDAERGPSDIPDEHESGTNEDPEAHARSLGDDILALFDDGRTYAEAELRFQRSRLGYAADRAKYAAIYGAAALGLFHLALIALTVGGVIALIPIVGAWAATAIVAVVLIVVGLVLLRALKGKFDEIHRAFSDSDR